MNNMINILYTIIIVFIASNNVFSEMNLRTYYESIGGIVDENRGELLIDLSEIKQLTDNDLKNIYQFRNLRNLSISDTRISDIGIDYISRNENIVSLGASSMKITGEGFKNFNKSGKLQILRLNDTLLNDDGLKYISELQNLEELQIGGTKITDNGLKLLQKIPKLKSLYINNTSITDTGLQYLAGVKNLQYVFVMGTKVTTKGIANLKRKILHCEIDNKLPADAGLK